MVKNLVWSLLALPPTMTTLSALIQPGNVAVVTGASSGIGRAAALSWAAAGMHVYMLDIDEAELSAAAAKGSGSAVKAVTVDVANEAAMKAVADEVFASHETVHIFLITLVLAWVGEP